VKKMSNNINDMIWEDIWVEIEHLEATLDDKFLDKVNEVSISHGYHQDDEREEILRIIADDMFYERAR
jgi:hypothetical protein